MTKDVLVSISGTQFMDAAVNDEPIEIVTNGNYYKKNNKHYVIYDEIIDGVNGVTKNTLKFDETFFNLTRSGAINTSMIFEENRRNMTNYNTPFGTLTIGIDASNIAIEETEEEINVNVDYAIDVNYEFLADCKIALKVQALNKKQG